MLSVPDFQPLTEGRIALCLQFWEGDKKQAMRNAVRIADNEEKPRNDVEFVFVERFDTQVDPIAYNIVAQKFRTSIHKSRRRGTGHPSGCNDMWCDLMSCGALGKYFRGEWKDVKCIFTFEGDSIPVHRDWINKMSAEWDRAAREKKFVVGCWMDVGVPGVGHINGNMLVPPNLAQIIPGVVGCPAIHAWDMYFASMFEEHWYKSGFIANYYKDLNVTEEQLKRTWGGWSEPAVVIHGVKDNSVEEYADKVLRKGTRFSY